MIKDDSEKHDFYPFFIIIIAVMIFLYTIALYTDPSLRKLPDLLVFSTAMVIHTLLHWFLWKISEKPRLLVIYFCIQSLLAGGLILYTREIGLLFGLFLALLGEEVGIYRGIKKTIIIVSLNVMLIAVTILIKGNIADMGFSFLLGVLPMIIFVIIYVNLYSRQYEAKIEAKKLLDELGKTNAKLTVSNARVEELTREKERQRIARELHDTLAQGLSGIILQLEAAMAYFDNGSHDRAEEIIQKSMEKARETLAGAREVIDDLRKEPRCDIGLKDYIQAEIEAMRKRSGINFSMNIDNISHISVETAGHLMKIITEALGNCAEHSEAENAELSLSKTDRAIVLEIRDDGKGFIPDNVGGGHYGLIGIGERCQILGGEFTIESSPGHGSALSVVIGAKTDVQQ